jgi:hypothetical protein
MPQVSLTLANTNYNLLALLYGAGGAIGSNLNSQGKENCSELTLRSDPTNVTSKIYGGDGAMTGGPPPTQFDVGPLNPGDSYKFGNAVRNSISLVNKFLRSDTAGVKVDVTVVYA